MATSSSSHSPAEPAATVAAFAAALRQGTPTTFGALTIIPLFGAGGEQPIVSLEQAMRAGHVTVAEVTSSGDVNSLRVTNTGATPVLLFDGEELVGAKQNRIVNTSILVPGVSGIDIPVSCVEQGRWRYRSPVFAAGTVLTPAMRRSKTARVTNNLRQTGAYDADQRAVWREVADYAARRGARSETGAYADVVTADRVHIADYVEALPCADGQTGLAAYLGGELVGADVIGSPAVYAALHARLVGALAAEAIDRPARAARKRQVTLSTAFAQAARGTAMTTQPPGLGTDVRLEAPRFVANALIHEGHVVHLALFPQPAA